jgi:hypothetical protein
MNNNRRKSVCSLIFFCLVILSVTSVWAQQSSAEEDGNFIKPTRPGVTNPAEIQTPGVLQVEYGIDASFNADDYSRDRRFPLSLRFAADKRLQLQLDWDTAIEQKQPDNKIVTGIGDVRLGFQVVALEDTEKHPALAFAYNVKLPTANADKELGTNRTDHRLTVLLSKEIGKNDFDFNVAYLNNGREESELLAGKSSRLSGVFGSAEVTHKFNQKLGVEGELSGSTADDFLPHGAYALGAVLYRLNKRVQLDGGARFGLTAETQRVGIFAGVTIGVGSFYPQQ